MIDHLAILILWQLKQTNKSLLQCTDLTVYTSAWFNIIGLMHYY